MAVKPCGVTYFSPLRGGCVSVTMGMFLSVDMREGPGFYSCWVGRRRRAAKSRQRLGFAVDLELALLEFNVAHQLLALTLGVAAIDGRARAGIAVGESSR